MASPPVSVLKKNSALLLPVVTGRHFEASPEDCGEVLAGVETALQGDLGDRAVWFFTKLVRGVVVAALQAMRELPREKRPKEVIGCEVWRDLDWLLDSEKVVMDASGHDDLAAALIGVFESQIAGGKRYDLATLGRRAAYATFLESHATDLASQVIFGMDLTPVVADDSKDIVEFVCGHIERFQADVRQKLAERLS